MERTPPDHTLYPRAYDDWALTTSILLDKACPGFLADTLCADNLTRQARFAALAEMEMSGPEFVAKRLRAAIGDEGYACGCEPLTDIARSFLVLRTRAVLEVVYGACPDGLLGLLRRLGPSPLDRDLYRAAFVIFSDPAHRLMIFTKGV